MSGYVRKTERQDRRLEVVFAHEGREHRSFTRNISLGGLFIEHDEPIPYGAKIQLRLLLPGQTEPIQVPGEVRWSEPPKEDQRGGIGVRFEGLRARDVWALNKFLEQPPDGGG